MIRVLLVEADLENRSRLLGQLAAESDVQVVGQCTQGDEAQDRIEVLRPDAVFLSAEMPDFRATQALQM
ncbi:MAG TPA: chemotaxis response regulator protein-glutamate methylesterase, partial [Gammaproteobacteria bacterium]|nr:chemotaxis response regulator protein-glutamate methylesterase [Gammaproteobacteria bacterium]